MREVGVSDTKVPRKIREMGEAFYGRVQAYDEALAADDPALLEQALARNVLSRPDADTRRLADYVRRTAAAFAAVPYESFLAGDVAFPPPPEGASA